jgi:hypothetical protein
MRPIAGLLAIAAVAAMTASGCRTNASAININGSITVSADLQKKAMQREFVLFIIAKDRGGVPVAVHRVVNPSFPLTYELGPEDMVVPGERPEGLLLIQVEMNTRGVVGRPAKGDLEGVLSEPIAPVQKGVEIVINREV